MFCDTNSCVYRAFVYFSYTHIFAYIVIINNDDEEMDSFSSDLNDPGGGEGQPRRGLRHPRSESDRSDDNSKRPKTNHVPDNNVQIPNIPTSNSFNILNNNVNEHETIRTSNDKRPNVPKSSEKVPPITIFDMTITRLINQIRNPNSTVRDVNIQYRLNYNGIRLIMNSVDDFKRVREYLRANLVKFFSHHLEEEKTMKYVMYGLYEINNNELKEILSDHELFPVAVSNLRIKKKRYDDQNIYLLQFGYDQNISLERLRTVRTINGVGIRFEKYLHNQNGITQCSN